MPNQYLRQDKNSRVMSPVTGVMEQPALPGQPVEIGNDGRVNAGLLPNNYDPCINVVAEEAVQAGDLCYLVNVGNVRKIRKASSLDRASLSTLFVKSSYAAGAPAVAYIHGVMVIPNPGSYQESDTGASLYLHETIPGYVQMDVPNTPTAWIQRVAIITDVTPTEVRCFYIGFLDRGKTPGSSVVDTDPLVLNHIADMDNPHSTTAAQVGALALALLGAADGVAGLDADARVPEVNLPLTQWKRLPVRVAVTSNVTINSPGAALDGVTLASNDRVLLLGQTAPAANGVYIWNGAGVPMTRATDADNGAEVWNGIWTVREGSHAGSGWLNTNASTPTLGTTGLTFTRVIGTPAFTNPMTTQGDLIVGMSNGTPTRLPGGLEGQVMTMVAGVPTWQTIVTTGMANPMTTYGDMIYGGTGGVGERIAVGSNGQVLTITAGRPQWVAPSTGMPNPLTDPYDILMADSGGNPSRLGTGTNGHVLTMVSGRPQWQAITFTGMTNPMTASGDLIVGGALGAAQRLAKGSNGQVLTLVAGMPAWQAPDTGFTNPMTTLGDLLVGASGGQASRLGIGTNGQVLTVVGGIPAWAAGMSNPMTTQGDLVIGNTGGAPMRLAKGANGQVLTLVAGAPAWAAPATGFTSPMTNVGDLIIGGSSGAPLRLGAGTDGHVLTLVSGSPAWQAPAASMTNPMTAQGDLIIGGVAGAPARLAKGTDGHVLTLVSGVPAWAVVPSGFTNPMTAAGDLIIGSTGGAPARLAKGTDAQVLTLVAGVPAWANAASGFSNPMTASGDLIVGGSGGAGQRLGKGTDGQVLKLVAGMPAWADEGTGGGGMTNPMTAAGDLIIGGTAGAPARLAKGTNSQILTLVAGVPAWTDAPAGTLPDPTGQAGKVLTSNGTTAEWETPSAGGGGMVITAPETILFDPGVADDGNGYVRPGDVMPYWVPSGPNSAMELAGPLNTASVPAVAGATYRWSGVPSGDQWMNTANERVLQFFAHPWKSIKLTCVRTSPDGTVDRATHVVKCAYSALVTQQPFAGALVTRWHADGVNRDGNLTDANAGVMELVTAFAKGPDDAFYLMNYGCLRRLTATTISTIAGDTAATSGTIHGYNEGTGSAVRFGSGATGLSFFANGDICVCDPVNRRLRRVTLAGVSTSFAGTGLGGAVTSPAPVGTAIVNNPYYSAIDNSDVVYFLDSATQWGYVSLIRKIEGGTVTTLCDLSAAFPNTNLQGLAITPTGTLYTSAGGRLVRVWSGGNHDILAGVDNDARSSYSRRYSGYRCDYDDVLNTPTFGMITDIVYQSADESDGYLYLLDSGAVRRVYLDNVSVMDTLVRTVALASAWTNYLADLRGRLALGLVDDHYLIAYSSAGSLSPVCEVTQGVVTAPLNIPNIPVENQGDDLYALIGRVSLDESCHVVHMGTLQRVRWVELDVHRGDAYSLSLKTYGVWNGVFAANIAAGDLPVNWSSALDDGLWHWGTYTDTAVTLDRTGVFSLSVSASADTRHPIVTLPVCYGGATGAFGGRDIDDKHISPVPQREYVDLMVQTDHLGRPIQVYGGSINGDAGILMNWNVFDQVEAAFFYNRGISFSQKYTHQNGILSDMQPNDPIGNPWRSA